MRNTYKNYRNRVIQILLLALIFLSNNLYSQDKSITTSSDSLAHASSVSKYSGINLQSEEQWSSFQNISDSVFFKENFILNDSIDVFGWHPYWNGKAYKNYNFSLLSTIAYFSYELNPKTGSYKTIHDWKTTNLIDSAKAVNPDIKVLLTVSNFGNKNNREFLGSFREKGARQQALIDSLQNLLALRKANGVAIDFESVGRLEKKHLTDFIKLLSASLKVKNYMLVMTIPAEDPHEIYDVKTLSSHVDKFVVMSYGYYWSKSKKAGPVAPLIMSKTWGENSVATTFEKYKKLGLSPSQMIIGIPYYGEMWETKATSVPSDVKGFVGNRTYKEIRKSFPISPKYDQESNSAYFSYSRQDNGQNRQLWFGDEQTLSLKYDWIKKNNIGGIGIWALGDDDGHTELWELIANKFAIPAPLTEKQKITSLADSLKLEGLNFFNKIQKTIRKRSELETPEIFIIIATLGLIFLILSFFIVKLKQFVKNNLKTFYLVPSLVLLGSLILDKDVLIESPTKIPAFDMILLLIATATLGILTANFVHLLLSDNKNLP